MDTLARFTLEHRRILAAVFAGLAVLAALSSQSAASGVRVVVAAHPIDSGAVLSDDDLRTVRFPDDVVPDGVLSAQRLLGRRVAGPMDAGEPFTSRRVLDPTALEGFGSGAVLAAVRIAPPGMAATARTGDVVDVVAVDPHGESPAQVVAKRVTIVTVPSEVVDGPDVTIRIATDEPTALALASAAVTSRFSLLLARGD